MKALDCSGMKEEEMLIFAKAEEENCRDSGALRMLSLWVTKKGG